GAGVRDRQRRAKEKVVGQRTGTGNGDVAVGVDGAGRAVVRRPDAVLAGAGALGAIELPRPVACQQVRLVGGQVEDVRGTVDDGARRHANGVPAAEVEAGEAQVGKLRR